MFLFNLRPYSNESLSSFIFRTAKENLMDQLTWILLLFQERFGYKTREDDLNWLDQPNIDKWSELLGVPLTELELLTFPNFCNRLCIPIGNELKSAWVLHHNTKVCPICLKENAYHRIEWSLTHLTTCNKHNVFLVDQCSECKRPFRPRDTISLKCICGNELLSSTVKIVSDRNVKAHQRYIYSCLTGSFTGLNSFVTSTETFFRAIEWLAAWIPQLLPLDKIPAIQNIELSEKLNTRHRLLRNKSPEQCVVIYTYAYQLLDNWPNNFYFFLERVSWYNKEKGIEKGIETFVNTSIHKLLNTTLEPIYREFINYLIKSNNISNNKSSFVPENEARILLNVSNTNLKDLLNETKCSFSSLTITMYNFQKVKEIQNKLSDLITQEQFCELWGLGKKVCRELINSELFGPVFSTKQGGVSSKLISSEKVNDIVNIISNNTSNLDNMTEPICSLYEFIHLYSLEIAPIILHGILQQEIKYFYNSSMKISEIKLLEIEATKYILKKIETNAKLKGVIPCKELSILLGVHITDVLYWINSGRFGNEYRELEAIPYSAYIQFKEKYITSFQLSILTGLSSRQILKKHSNGLIKSISGPKYQDGKRLLFPKEVCPNRTDKGLYN